MDISPGIELEPPEITGPLRGRLHPPCVSPGGSARPPRLPRGGVALHVSGGLVDADGPGVEWESL